MCHATHDKKPRYRGNGHATAAQHTHDIHNDCSCSTIEFTTSAFTRAMPNSELSISDLYVHVSCL